MDIFFAFLFPFFLVLKMSSTLFKIFRIEEKKGMTLAFWH